MSILFEEKQIAFHEIFHPVARERNVRLTIARLDQLHPVVSGNKLFKLHYFLEEAIASGKNIITFGGAWSNHLVATAYAAKQLGLDAIGIVRGEKPEEESATLLACRTYGMKLEFIPRALYKNSTEADSLESIRDQFPDRILIPEGGYHPDGAKGGSLIMERLEINSPTHVCVAVGTATTFAGLIAGAKEKPEIIGYPVLKNMIDIDYRISRLIGTKYGVYKIFDSYHFGGYAKSTDELIGFMNSFYRDHNVPLDFVYTAKMMFGTIEEIRRGYFPEGSYIICLHTGGLQGNESLKEKLIY